MFKRTVFLFMVEKYIAIPMGKCIAYAKYALWNTFHSKIQIVQFVKYQALFKYRVLVLQHPLNDKVIFIKFNKVWFS